MVDAGAALPDSAHVGYNLWLEMYAVFPDGKVKLGLQRDAS